MEDFSLAALKSLILANQLLSAGLLSLLITAVIVRNYWEEVSYFLTRVWHSFPLIGTVARLSRKPASVDAEGWINHEVTLSNVYNKKFKLYAKDANAYSAYLDYLSKAGEAGRSARPWWVLAVVLLLVVIEAMGFAYVVAGWVNMDASTNDRHWLTAFVAILLAVASAFLAEAAGHAVHHNSLVARARHWWQGEEPSKRSRSLKANKAINLEDSFSDSDKPDYEQLLARVKDVNANVTRKFFWLITCGAFVVAMAIGAFLIRSATLDSIETEMVNGMRAEASTQSSTAGSPFDLPAESQAINDEADNATIDDKMQAIRKASLTTYVMLSLIYVAIQGISLWLASRYFFAGTHSHTAWQRTHKYATSEEMLDAMDQKRSAIASHADDKLRRLQTLLSSRDHTDANVLTALDGENTARRNFLSFVEHKADKVSEQPEKPARPIETVTPATAAVAVAVAATPVEPQPAVAPVAPAAAVAEPVGTVAIKASEFHDVTGLPEESLAAASRALNVSEAQLRDIREQQQALKALGLFPAKKEGMLS